MMRTKEKAIIILISAALFVVGIAMAKDHIVLHEEFAGLLFDRLNLGQENAHLSKAEKISTLSELNYQPRGGYTVGKEMTFGEMAVVLVRVLNFESQLPDNYTEEDAIEFLLKKEIITDQEKPNQKLFFSTAMRTINNIADTSTVVPHNILLPRIPVEPPFSQID